MALQQKPYCLMWFNHSLHPVRTPATVNSIDGVPTIVNNRHYCHCLLSCRVPISLIFSVTHVSLLTSKWNNTTVYIPVTYPIRNTNFAHTFGHCQANGISFGHLGDDQARWIVEWVEINRFFGIRELNMYNGTMQVGPLLQRVLDYYQSQGTLQLYQQPPPLSQFDPMKREYAELAMRTAFNDCMYRNMYRYRYVVSVDLDEIIVPKTLQDYYEILSSLEPKLRGGNYSSIMFHSKAFYQSVLGIPQNVSSFIDLRTTKYVYHVQDGRIKPFINPRYCLAGFSHYCLESFPRLNKITVPHTKHLAQVHHYRNQCFKEKTRSDEIVCKRMWEHKTINTRMQHFAVKLFPRIKAVWSLLNI